MKKVLYQGACNTVRPAQVLVWRRGPYIWSRKLLHWPCMVLPLSCRRRLQCKIVQPLKITCREWRNQGWSGYRRQLKRGRQKLEYNCPLLYWINSALWFNALMCVKTISAAGNRFYLGRGSIELWMWCLLASAQQQDARSFVIVPYKESSNSHMMHFKTFQHSGKSLS